MSYILEALRKSDAERGRGAVPDLHAQPIALASDDDDVATGRGKLWLVIGAAAAILLAAGVAWRLMPREAPPVLAAAPVPVPMPVPTPAPLPPVPVAVSPSPPLTLPEAAVTAAAAPVAPAASTLPMPSTSTPTPTVPAAAPTAVAAAAPAAESARKPAPRARAKPPAAATAAVAKKPALAPQPAQRVPLLAELPDELRRQVPAMVIGGSVYSPQPASRMLIVNGQVVREGNPVAADVQLEQIGSKAAVFSIRGQRFEVPL